jgi:hypothetical protein
MLKVAVSYLKVKEILRLSVSSLNAVNLGGEWQRRCK